MFRSLHEQVSRFPKRRGLLTLLSVVVLTVNASAADIVVNTIADSGTGSLREALSAAAAGDRIVFDIAGVPTITLLSDLPTVAVDLSFFNNNPTAVTIDRGAFAALSFTGSSLNPTVLVFAASATDDIVTAVGTTVFGNGTVVGNLQVPGTIAPGANANAGTVGTFVVMGDLDITGAQVQLDISATGGAVSSDLINVSGTVTALNSTLVPNFVGDEFAAGQTFLVLDAGSAITDPFLNETSVFDLPSNPFLEAIQNGALGADQFGFLIQDNGITFASVAPGSNQLSAATLLDQLQVSATPPPSIAPLRNGSTAETLLAFDQLSGSIYPSLIGAEINHIQNNLEGVRDRVALQFVSRPGELTWTPWVRGYGVSAEVDRDDQNTLGYRHEIGGIEVGCGISDGGALEAGFFSHLANANLDTREADQHADVESYRVGGLVQYVGQQLYVVAAGGGGTQRYEVRRSLSQFVGSTFAESTFDGSSQFGYFEIGTNYLGPWTPYVASHLTRVALDPITETGDVTYALINSGGEGDSFRGVLGLSYQESALTPLGIATTRLRFGWLHEYLDASETFVSQIANGGTPTGTLTDQGAAPGIDWGFVRAQVDMGTLLGGQLSCAYEGQFNSDSSFNALLGGARWVY